MPSIPATAFSPKTRRCPAPASAPASTFIGPCAELLELLGDKTAARRLAQRAGIPVVPGTEEAGQRPANRPKRSPPKIGFPLIVKAAFGGGGRGMRVVDKRRRFRRPPGRGAPRSRRGLRQRRRLPGTLRAPRPPHRSADPGRPARQHPASLRARLLGAAPPPEGGGSGAGRRARSRHPRARWPKPPSHSPAPPATTTPARSSSWWMPTRASGTSSKSTRAFRWNTPSPKW